MRFLDHTTKRGIDQRRLTVAGRRHQLVGVVIHLLATSGTAQWKLLAHITPLIAGRARLIGSLGFTA